MNEENTYLPVNEKRDDDDRNVDKTDDEIIFNKDVTSAFDKFKEQTYQNLSVVKWRNNEGEGKTKTWKDKYVLVNKE